MSKTEDLLTVHDIAEICGLAKSSAYAKIRRLGDALPSPIPGLNVMVWRKEDIEQHLIKLQTFAPSAQRVRERFNKK